MAVYRMNHYTPIDDSPEAKRAAARANAGSCLGAIGDIIIWIVLTLLITVPLAAIFGLFS